MKSVFIFLLLAVGNVCLAQQLSSEKFNFELKTSLSAGKTQMVNAYINEKVFSIELVKLLPECTVSDSVSRKRCIYRSIIGEEGIDQSRISERIRIPEAEFKCIFQAVYGYEGEILTGVCYEPRHGICFYDEKNNLTGYIEICFTCINTRSTGIPAFESFPEEGYEELENIFKKYALIHE